MKKFLLAAAALAAFPAYAAPVNPGTGFAGSAPASIDPLDQTTRGTRLIFAETSGTALTFSATFRSAVYRNTAGTLDFYYQVARTGPGSTSDQQISSFTVAEFDGFTVNALRDGSNFDGDGGFAVANNPSPMGAGFTSVARRNISGEVVTIDFFGTGFNGLIGTETSTTYILRTNATAFTSGTFGVIDGSTLQGTTFAPTVPEPATWAMMIGGFGMLGAAARRSARAKSVLA